MQRIAAPTEQRCMRRNADSDPAFRYDFRMVVIRTILAGLLVSGCASGPMGEECGGATGRPCPHSSDTVWDKPNVWMPKLERHQVVRGDAIAGVEIAVDPLGAAAWTVRIKSASAGALLWDESSFVGSNGSSAGRLIPGATTRMDLARAHPPSPLPAGASLSESVFVEKLIDEEEVEAKMPQYWTDTMVKQVVAHRKEIATFVEGGTINLVVQVGSEKKTWTGHVEHVAETAPPSAESK